MTTLRDLETSQGAQKAATTVADYYQKDIEAWAKTSMNNGFKNAQEIVGKFRVNSISKINARVLLEDAVKY
ncbi:hypothetical protein [Formivibrio citricus]|uniref:hypothetical protein n=1 Tax=Formivibrio citricus TaxID=83765 RepID=UPI0011604ADD|nr:hypothetical protein [Formivibrio citricus]